MRPEHGNSRLCVWPYRRGVLILGPGNNGLRHRWCCPDTEWFFRGGFQVGVFCPPPRKDTVMRFVKPNCVQKGLADKGTAVPAVE